MTTAVELNKALNNLGVKSVLVATGQTGLMQGAKYGVAIDALVSQFVIGEIEHAVVQAFEQESPDHDEKKTDELDDILNEDEEKNENK